MHINQQARLAADQLRKGKPNQADRFRIASILEEIATQFEEIDKSEPVEPVIPDTVEGDPELSVGGTLVSAMKAGQLDQLEDQPVEVVEDGK